MAAAAAGCPVLADDLTPVCLKTLRVLPGPERTVSATLPLPLGGVFDLQRKGHLHLRPLSAREAVRTTLRHLWGSGALKKEEALNTCTRLNAVPVHQLLVPDDTAPPWPEVAALIQSGT
jgi:hypothetical protein